MSELPEISIDILEQEGGITENESETPATLTESSDSSNNKKENTAVSKPVKYVKLPFAKIKHIMKMDPDCVIVQQDAVFLVTKATEMFIEFLTKETNKQLTGNKRKTIMKKDVDATVESIPQLCFLDGALE
ncbi:DNA polymerase epsilon subunit 4 [Sitophilus oryzae]|uniref:DNA polymerase epsilon subunit 4 n=1 Tax=Sitophilus oryzae TaxID=7048 RepID=A0A6J2YKQ5_SITOR|nr:DNA polymerase epsilon subunit 4 [Sitophilus oryzae]